MVRWSMSDGAANPESDILMVVVDVMQTDLKLGDMALNRETVLAGGDLGLDSLDLLDFVNFN